jgi:hypothetical protein
MDNQNNNANISRSSKWLEDYFKLTPRKSYKDIDALAYIAEKTSRIGAVTLKLVDGMDKESPLREDLERTSLGLVRDGASFGYSGTARERFYVGGATLSALLRTASLSGYVSEMNTNILLHEIHKLIKTCSEAGLLEGRVYVAGNAMSVDLPAELYSDERTDAQRPYERQIKDERVLRKVQYGASVSPFAQRTQGTEDQHGTNRSQERVQAVQKDRRATILGLLQKKDKITVKDVSLVIKDCSEKTIQRELAALVAQGVLKREGERRWSTYSLI